MESGRLNSLGKLEKFFEKLESGILYIVYSYFT